MLAHQTSVCSRIRLARRARRARAGAMAMRAHSQPERVGTQSGWRRGCGGGGPRGRDTGQIDRKLVKMGQNGQTAAPPARRGECATASARPARPVVLSTAPALGSPPAPNVSGGRDGSGRADTVPAGPIPSRPGPYSTRGGARAGAGPPSQNRCRDRQLAHTHTHTHTHTERTSFIENSTEAGILLGEPLRVTRPARLPACGPGRTARRAAATRAASRTRKAGSYRDESV
jgi:hypothetical protein